MVLSSIPLDDACCCCCVDVLCLLEGLVLMLLLLLLLHRGEFDPLPPEEYVTLRLVLLFIHQLSTTIIISSDSTSVSSEAELCMLPASSSCSK